MRWVGMRFLVAWAGMFVWLAFSASAQTVLPDLEGRLQHPLQPGTNRAHVLLFLLTDCPVANSYAPEINRLVGEYTPKGVRFFLVHVDAELKQEEAAKHARDFGFQCPVVIDREHALVRRTGVTITPEAVVLGAEGRRLYRGRIDNQQAALGKRRPRPTTHELRDALDAILAGKPVQHPETKAIGCYIPTVEVPKR